MSGCLWFLVVVLAATYSGNLVATLATRHVSLPFSTLNELVEDDTYQLSVTYGNVGHLVLEVDMLYFKDKHPHIDKAPSPST